MASTEALKIAVQEAIDRRGQELIEVAVRMDARMHVAIDDAQPAPGGFFLGEDGAVDDVTHAILLRYSKSYAASFSRGKVSNGLSAHMRDTMLAGRCGGIGSSPSNCQCG